MRIASPSPSRRVRAEASASLSSYSVLSSAGECGGDISTGARTGRAVMDPPDPSARDGMETKTAHSPGVGRIGNRTYTARDLLPEHITIHPPAIVPVENHLRGAHREHHHE